MQIKEPLTTAARRWLSARLDIALPAVVFALSLSLFAGTALWRAGDIRSEAQVEIERSAERLAAEIHSRFDHAQYGLKGAKGLYAHDNKSGVLSFVRMSSRATCPRNFLVSGV